MPKPEDVLDLYIDFAQSYAGQIEQIDLKPFLDQLKSEKDKQEFKELVEMANALIQAGQMVHLKVMSHSVPILSARAEEIGLSA